MSSRDGLTPGERARPGDTSRPHFDLFEILSDPARAAFTAAARPRHLSSGQFVYQQGEVGAEMLRVVSGAVRLSLLRPDGRELLLVAFQPGDCFGVSSLIDRLPLPHTATAVGRVELQVIGAEDFAALRADDRTFDTGLLWLFCAQMRMLSDHLADATLEDVPHQLIRRLLQLSRSGSAAAPEVRISQAELGLMFGVARQTINRLLSRLENEGLIRRAYGVIRLEDIAALERRARQGDD